MQFVPPGATLGVFGSGQLGRMFALAAIRMGYRINCYSPESGSPTGQVADKEFVGPYDDLDTVTAFAKSVQVATFEFENVASAAGETAAKFVPVHPSPYVLHTCQHRLREGVFLGENHFPVAESLIVGSLEDLKHAVITIGFPGVLKTAGFGYDGKGQVMIRAQADIAAAWEHLKTDEAIYERFIDFEKEISVVGSRSQDGQFSHFGVIENSHANHILDISFAPADVSSVLKQQAIDITQEIMIKLEVIGLLCVEMFVTKNGRILVNEIAPRPHNSGHLTIEACTTSQFEEQVRMICGLAHGSLDLVKPAAMANLLGDIWENGEPRWSELDQFPDVKLHLYGKKVARPGRKMGHLTTLAGTPKQAVARVKAAREALRS